MDAPLLYVVTVGADGTILQTARAGSTEAAAAFPTPSGGAVLVFSDPPDMAQETHRWDAATHTFVLLPPVVVPPPPVPTLDELKAAKDADVGAQLNERIATGLLVGGLHVQIDDGARGNLIGLVTMATLVGQGVTTWPEGYSRGWVTAEGPRIALPTPADGVQLALAASAYYSGLVQHAQDLVDAIAAAADETVLAVVDITAGWPA